MKLLVLLTTIVGIGLLSCSSASPEPWVPTPEQHASNQSSIASFNKGNEYFDSSEWELAIRSYDKAIRGNSRYAEAYKRRGDSYGILGLLHPGGVTPNDTTQAALDDYTKAIMFDPNLASAYQGRGNILYFLGSDAGEMDKVRSAIGDFSKAIQLDPRNADNYAYRAIAYGTIGQYINAEADEAKACELDKSRCP
jgi:tetratricopeptide (TPR) repeat protein